MLFWCMRVVLARSLCIMDVVLNKKVGRSGPRRHSVESIAMAVTLVLLVAICAALWALAKKSGSGKEAPGPFRWPIIGNLPQLRDAIPYRALTDIGKKFGPVFSLQLGSVPVVVVSGLDNIKQVLYHKLNHFDSRPNFNRYHKLFDGDKENCKFIWHSLRKHASLFRMQLYYWGMIIWPWHSHFKQCMNGIFAIHAKYSL